MKDTINRTELIQQIIENIARLRHCGSKKRLYLDKLGLTRAQMELLYLVFYRPDITIKTIAESIGTSKSAVTQLIDPLQTAGLLQRQPDLKDRRIIHINMTAKGHKLLKKLKSRVIENVRTTMDVLSDQELVTLARLHRKMVSTINLKDGAS